MLSSLLRTVVAAAAIVVAAFVPGRAAAVCVFPSGGPATCSGPPPIPTPIPHPNVPPGFSLAVHGRLRSGGTLQVGEVAGSTEGYQPQPALLCYKHGSSARVCANGGAYQSWTIVLLPGRQQYLTLEIGGETVARIVYRNVQIHVTDAAREYPAPVFVADYNGLVIPNLLRVGEQLYVEHQPLGPATLCYKHGTSSLQCTWSRYGGFYLGVAPGHDQYFTIRIGGKIVARRIYRNVT